MRQKNITFGSYSPYLVLKAALCWSPSLILTLLYPQHMSNLEKRFASLTCEISSGIKGSGYVADDFGYVCLDKGKRRLVNVVEGSKHNAETSHAQRPKQ